MSEHQPTSPEKSQALVLPEIVHRLNDEVAYTPEVSEMPLRCRALVFSPDGSKVLGIVRQKPGREPYAVFPGGGVEEGVDKTAVAAVRRELREELGKEEADIHLTGRVLRFADEVGGDQFYYIGVAAEEFDDLAIKGPEADRDPLISGTYSPQWIPVEALVHVNMQPGEVTQVIESVR